MIDAAGPFQGSATTLVEACIGAQVDYLDLADGRDWVVGFAERFDAAASAAGVAQVSGASSIPALSHAVLDLLVAGWREVEAIRIGIFPGNRAPRGLSVVEAILSYSGKPVRVFRTGRWDTQWGWGGLHRVDAGPAGKRWASACDTPEQDLLVARYRPTLSAEFFAGMELSVLHLGLACSACRCDGDGSNRSAPPHGPCCRSRIGCCRSVATRARCWSRCADRTETAGRFWQNGA